MSDMKFPHCPGCGAELEKHVFVSIGITDIFLCRNCYDDLEFKEKRDRLGKGSGIDREYPIDTSDGIREFTSKSDRGAKFCPNCGFNLTNAVPNEGAGVTICSKCNVILKDAIPTPDRLAELRAKYIRAGCDVSWANQAILDINELLVMLEESKESARVHERCQEANRRLSAEIDKLKAALEAKEKEVTTLSYMNDKFIGDYKALSEEYIDMKAKLAAKHDIGDVLIAGAYVKERLESIEGMLKAKEKPNPFEDYNRHVEAHLKAGDAKTLAEVASYMQKAPRKARHKLSQLFAIIKRLNQ